MVLKGLGLFSEMVAEWSPSLLDALAPPVSCVKASAQMGRTRKQPRAFDWKDLEKQKWVMLPITKILHTWFSASLTKLENKSTVYISGRWFKKKKGKQKSWNFPRWWAWGWNQCSARGQAGPALPDAFLSLTFLSLSHLPQGCPRAGDQGDGVGAGAPTGPDRTAGCAGTRHEGAPRAQGCGCLQLGLQTDTSLTFGLALPGCLAPLPSGLKPSQCSVYTGVALPQSSSLLREATTGLSLRKSKRDGPW